MASFVMDGNFSAEHLKMRRPTDDIPLADGHGFMVTDGRYKEHLKAAVDVREVCRLSACMSAQARENPKPDPP